MGYGYSHEVSHDGVAYNRETGERVGAVHTTDQAAHVWAQGRVTFGRSSKGVVYFHGRALFDYGPHYCAGYLHADGASVLINGERASVTTSQHVHTARHAASPRAKYVVPDLTGLLAGQEGASLRVPYGASRGELEGTREWEAELDARLSDREHVRGYCERHALALDPDAMRFLLAGVGLPNSADKIRREAEAARDRREAELARNEKRQAIEDLRTIATAESIESYVAGRAPSYDSGDRAERHADEIARLIRKARRAAGKDSVPPTFWREAWNRLKLLDPDAPDSAVPAIARLMDKRAGARARSEARAGVRNAILNFRADRPAEYTAGDDAPLYLKLRQEIRYASRQGSHATTLAHAIGRYLPGAGRAAIEAAKLAHERLELYADGIEAAPAFIAAREAWEADEAARREAERLEAERIEAEKLARWLAGDRSIGRIYKSRDCGAAYIRAVDVQRDASGAIVGGTLETSQGAQAPLREAVRAFRFIKLVRERGEPWHANGAQVIVGHFRLDRITAAGDMRAGCHRFAWQDIAALAQELGVFELPADDSAVTRSREAA